MYEIVDHVADVRLRVAASDMPQLLEEAMKGLFAVLSPRGSAEGAPLSRAVEVDSADATCLVVDFLNEVLSTAIVERACFVRLTVASLSETSLSGTIEGRRVEGFDDDVKAVTYHEAELRRTADGLETMLVLDI